MARCPQPGATRSSAPSTARAAQVELHGKVRVEPFARPGESSDGLPGPQPLRAPSPARETWGAPRSRPGRRRGLAATRSDRGGPGGLPGCSNDGGRGEGVSVLSQRKQVSE